MVTTDSFLQSLARLNRGEEKQNPNCTWIQRILLCETEKKQLKPRSDLWKKRNEFSKKKKLRPKRHLEKKKNVSLFSLLTKKQYVHERRKTTRIFSNHFFYFFITPKRRKTTLTSRRGEKQNVTFVFTDVGIGNDCWSVHKSLNHVRMRWPDKCLVTEDVQSHGVDQNSLT